MPKIELNIQHNLSQSEALSRIQRFLPELKVQHSEKISDLEESWSDNTVVFKFKISGFKVSGNLVAEEHQIIIRGDLPLFATMFSSTIESTIRKHAEELLTQK